MSQDLKPGRMRVVSGGNNAAAPVPQRRRGDGATAVTVENESSHAAAAAGAVPARNGKTGLMLAILFLASCAIGGAALPLLGVL